MKTLINSVIAYLFIGIGTIIAQVAPEPPAPPAPPSTTVSTTTGNSRVSIKTRDSSTGENIAISISNSSDEYRFKGNFPAKANPELLSYLMETMGSKNLTRKGGRTEWIANTNGDEVYKISLGSGRLLMEVDKEIASNTLVEKFVAMGMEARTIITGEDAQDEERKRLEREADRLRRDAQRMQREAERLERQAKSDYDRVARDAKRASEDAERIARDISRTSKDAERVKREAERVLKDAERLGHMTAAKGGMDSSVKEVLRKANTYYDASTAQNVNGWVWPAFQQALLLSLEEEQLIKNDSKVVFVKDETGMYVNGEKLNDAERSLYNGLLRKHGLAKMDYFTFYKQNDHIMVINSNAEILEFFDDLKEMGEISSVKKAVKIEINGDSVMLDGTSLSTAKVKMINNLLTKHNIIPVPGKTIELMKKGSYKLGYSIGKRTHIGTWGILD